MYDKPLPQILKMALKRARDQMVKNEIISGDSNFDKVEFPTYDPADASTCTQRELTFALIKQRDFLYRRVLSLSEVILQNSKFKYLKKRDLMHDCEQEELSQIQ